MDRVKKIFGLGIPAAVVCALGYLAARLRLSMPRTEGQLNLRGLSGEVEVIYDKAGIPHITAESTADGFRALGFVMAQDRMVQMQLMLRVAKGRLCEVIGKMALDMDRFMRTANLTRAAESLAGNLEPHSTECLGSFCEGVNEYLAQPKKRLPFEFMVLKGRPEPWAASDILLLGLFTAWLLDSFWPADLMREKIIRTLGLERATELLPETSEYNNPPVKVDGPGVRAETLPLAEEVDWDFQSEGGGAEWINTIKAPAGYGSNNWALSGSRTRSGKPILCGDPHVQHNAPGLLYLLHLKTPDYNSIGATFAGLPVVAFGHNEYCGWSSTALCADMQDLYVETFESEDSNRYLYKGEWLEAEVIEEEIKIRFAKSRKLKVLWTHHGPIIKRKGNKGLALRWGAHEVSFDTLGAMLAQNRAHSWDEFLEANQDFVGPGANQVYADVEGNIGYAATAKVPVRLSGDGTIPCDGSSGEGEWDEDPLPYDRMPRVLNPEEGFIVTANSKIVSEGYPELISKNWELPFRNGRISELLRSKDRWAPEDMAVIHGDALTVPGRCFAKVAVSAASGGNGLSPLAEQAIDYLGTWDYQARADSVAMSIYFFSWRHLCEELLRHRLGSTLAAEYLCSWSTINLAIQNMLERRDDFWLPPGYGSYDGVVLGALEAGVKELETAFGNADMTFWKWGRIHYLTCQNLLGLFWPLTRLLNVGPVPRDGEGDTVNAAPPASDCLSQLLARGTMGGCTDMPLLPDCQSHAAYGGPVLRMVLDFSDLDNSRAVLDVGQSGHRLSPHYKDHFPHW